MSECRFHLTWGVRWAVVLVTFLWATGAQALYATRAVVFPFGTYLATGNIPDNDLSPLGGSPSGLACFWYNAGGPPRFGYAYNFMEASALGNTEVVFGLFAHRSLTGAQTLDLYLSDTVRWAHFESVGPVPFDGKWHYIGITWDLALNVNGTYAIQGVLDRNPLAWVEESNTRGAPIYVPYRNADHWFVGSAERNARPFDQYGGMLSQVYLHVGLADYLSILNPKRGLPGCAMVNSLGQFGPMEYGPQCSGPFGVPADMNEYLPILCLTGGIDTFQKNQGGASTFGISPNGTRAPLLIAPNDPFEVFK